MTVSGLPFFGRGDVLSTLARHLSEVRTTGSGRMLTVRGRRQVGKSTVVERFVEGAETPYVFVAGAYQSPLTRQLADAGRATSESRTPLPNAELLGASPPATWADWLARIALAAQGGAVVVVLDEFPWLLQSDPSLEGELQRQWDRVLERLPVLLILIGSDVAMMESLAEHGRPLFGRTRGLVVPPLNPAEVGEAIKAGSAFDAFDAYLVTGGYPRLVLDLARSGASVADFVRGSLADPYSPLVSTARFSLDAEFPEPQAAYQVLAAIGANDKANPGFMDLSSAVGESEAGSAQTAVTRALKTLTEVKGLVERETPAWASPKTKLRRYRVKDPYLRFWFRYVESNVERVFRGRSDLVISRWERDWQSWRGRSVEPVLREGLERLAVHEPTLATVERVQPWWTRDGSVEVDWVASSMSATELIGSIKWRERGTLNASEVRELRHQTAVVPRAANARLAAVCPDGENIPGVDVVFGAEGLLRAWRA